MLRLKWEPFGGLTGLRREMDRLFGSFFGRAFSFPRRRSTEYVCIENAFAIEEHIGCSNGVIHVIGNVFPPKKEAKEGKDKKNERVKWDFGVIERPYCA